MGRKGREVKGRKQYPGGGCRLMGEVKVVWKEGGRSAVYISVSTGIRRNAARGGYWGSRERFYVVELSDVGVNRFVRLQ